MTKEKSPLLSSKDLRIIAISLSILGLGYAVAYGGFMYSSSQKQKALLNTSATVSATLTPMKESK